MVPTCDPALGSVCTFFLPKIWSAIWQKEKLDIEVQSLKAELRHVLGIIQDCRLRGSDPGGTLNIAKLRQMANEIEDCIQSCQIAKTLKTRADLIRMIPNLKERSKELGKIIRPSRNQYHHPRERNQRPQDIKEVLEVPELLDMDNHCLEVTLEL